MKKLISVFLLTSMFSSAYGYEVSSSVTFTSDYRFRGISQTEEDPAVQGSLDASFDNGIYLGVWGSNVDFGDDAHLEVDWYLGYSSSIGDSISWDATVFYYTYPGYDSYDADFLEFGLAANYNGLRVGYNHTNDFFNTSETSQYFSIDYSHEFEDVLVVSVHAGYSFGDYWDDLDIGDYQDFSVSVGKDVGGINVDLSYLINNIDEANEIESGLFSNDDTFQITVSRSF